MHRKWCLRRCKFCTKFFLIAASTGWKAHRRRTAVSLPAKNRFFRAKKKSIGEQDLQDFAPILAGRRRPISATFSSKWHLLDKKCLHSILSSSHEGHNGNGIKLLTRAGVCAPPCHSQTPIAPCSIFNLINISPTAEV